MARARTTSKKGSKKAKKRPATQVGSSKRDNQRSQGTTEEVVGQLVEEGDKAAVLSVVRQMELHIKKLQLDLAQDEARSSGRHSEGVTSDQLALLFDELKMARQKAARPPTSSRQSEDGDAGRAVDDRRRASRRRPKRTEDRRPSAPERRHAAAVAAAGREPAPGAGGPRTRAPECEEPLTEIEAGGHRDHRLRARPRDRAPRQARGACLCRANDCTVVRGPLGDKVIPGGIYGSQSHRAHRRLEVPQGRSRFIASARTSCAMGFDMPSASITDQVLWTTELLEPIWRALLDEVDAEPT